MVAILLRVQWILVGTLIVGLAIAIYYAGQPPAAPISISRMNTPQQEMQESHWQLFDGAGNRRYHITSARIQRFTAPEHRLLLSAVTIDDADNAVRIETPSLHISPSHRVANTEDGVVVSGGKWQMHAQKMMLYADKQTIILSSGVKSCYGEICAR